MNIILAYNLVSASIKSINVNSIKIEMIFTDSISELSVMILKLLRLE